MVRRVQKIKRKILLGNNTDVFVTWVALNKSCKLTIFDPNAIAIIKPKVAVPDKMYESISSAASHNETTPRTKANKAIVK